MGLFKTYRPAEEGFADQYNVHLTQRTSLGDWFLKKVIIPHTIALTKGLVVDFGCGVGEILSGCPKGSIGLEINKTSVDYCQKKNLNVLAYAPENDNYAFNMIPTNTYQTFLMSHVLEHIPDTANVLRTILNSCNRLGISRVIIKVPGLLMYQRDKTHVTFVDRSYLETNDLISTQGFRVTKIEYFPINMHWFGKYSPIDEMIVVYDSKSNEP